MIYKSKTIKKSAITMKEREEKIQEDEIFQKCKQDQIYSTEYSEKQQKQPFHHLVSM